MLPVVDDTHTVEKIDGELATDALRDGEALTDGEAATATRDALTDAEEGRDALRDTDASRDALTEGDPRVPVSDRDGVTLKPRVGDGDDDLEGTVHCT